MRKKLGIGTIEINKKFKNKEEAFKYAKRLREYIRYLCKNKANTDWFAQAMIVVSNNRGNASYLHYDINKKPGRPKKKLRYSKYELEWYKGNIKIDWHLHILLVSSPSYAFRNEIKKYIDKNWNNASNIIEEKAFNNNNIKEEKAYKKECNIKIADYFINQSEDILFCNYNYSGKENLKYSLKEYYREFLKTDSAMTRLIRENIKNPMEENKYLNAEKKIWARFKEIEEFFYDISNERDKLLSDEFMNKIKFQKIKDNYNKVQKNTNRTINAKMPF